MSRKDKEIKEIQVRLKKLRKLEAPSDLADEILSKTIGPKSFQFNFLAALFNLNRPASLKTVSIGVAMIFLMAISLTIFYRMEERKSGRAEGVVAVKKIASHEEKADVKDKNNEIASPLARNDSKGEHRGSPLHTVIARSATTKQSHSSAEFGSSALPLFRSVEDVAQVNQLASSSLGGALIQVASDTSSVEPLLTESILMNAEATTRISESLLQALVMISEVNQINIQKETKNENENENETPSNNNL